jgi:hypothetical protein
MNKITFSLNYRKPKSEYNGSDELYVCIRQYYKIDGETNGKIRKSSTGIKCKLDDWNTNWHDTDNRMPINESDPDHLKKNKLLKRKVEEFLKRDYNLSINKPIGSVKLNK